MIKQMITGILVCGITVSTMANGLTGDKKTAKSSAAIAKVIEMKPIEVVAERVQKYNPISLADQKLAKFNAYESLALYTANTENDTSVRKADTTEIKVGKTRIVVIGEPKIEKIYMEKDSTGDFDDEDYKANKNKRKESKSDDYLEMNIGFNGFLDNGNTSLSAPYKALDLENNKSINFSLSYNKRFNIIRDNVQLSAGIGLDWNNYRFSQNISLKAKQDSLTLFYDSVGTTAINYKKNKLMSRYVILPVMLHIATNKSKNGNRLLLAGGVELGYLINGRTKQVSDEKGKQKVSDDFNMNDLRYGFIGKIGYGDFGVYAKYYPQSVFAKNEGPNLNTYCVGITFGGF